MLLSYTIVDFYFYYNNGAVDMQICTLLTRIQCKVSDTQVTVKAFGPLVITCFKIQHSDCYCIKCIKCSFTRPLLIFIYSMMGR